MSRRGESFLEAASRIGLALVRSAYWDSDHRLCNWVGRSTRERMAADAPVVPTVAALGPDLYGGSSGVALFLAQLAAVTDDDEMSSTAAAACANALRNVERQPVREFPAMSFHSGLIGVAFATHRIVALTGDWHDLATRADAILERAAEAIATPHVFDVIGGNAGAILALLALGRSLCRPVLFELATMLGDELVEAAERRGDAWSWHPDLTTGPEAAAMPLTGLAHGASGLGLSLLELHAATGRGDFLEAGRGAFFYEDTLFNEEQGNWPDLRAQARANQLPRHRARLRDGLVSRGAWDRARSNPRGDARSRAGATRTRRWLGPRWPPPSTAWTGFRDFPAWMRHFAMASRDWPRSPSRPADG